jgi:threonyl-tRNA synthetase
LRILQLHSNFIEYAIVEKEIDLAEEVEKKLERVEEVVVLFVAVEEDDDTSVALKAMKNTKVSLERLKVNRVMIYPYAHLSSHLAKPATAMKILKEMKNVSQEMGLETYSAPFGWCKKFSISIKGHPLAEHLRVVTSAETKEETVSEALKAEEKLKSFWYILHPKGDLIPVDEFRFKECKNLEKLCKYEINKVRAVHQVPPHVTLMKRLEIADYEPGSDPGNLRWYPKGRLIKSLFEQYVTERVIDYGGMEVETPIMYDIEHPAISNYLQRFPARQYLLSSDKRDFFLRFSACFGQFLMIHDTQFSYRQLPLRIYELTKYSFRREKSGELTGLRRLRCFTMPDCHALVADLEQAKKEFLIRFKLSIGILENGLDLSKDNDYELAIRVTKEFYDENKDFVQSMVKLFGKPVLVELWEERFFYFVLKWEFNFIDNLNKASALSTDQIDIENARHYDMTYVNENGEKQYPLVLHCSPSGGIERGVYALLEKAHRDSLKGKPPTIPLWLSPTQVRIIPVSEKFLEFSEKLMKQIEKSNIRVDLDDRSLSLGKKVRAAEKEWISYIIVIGENEVNSDVLPVRERTVGKQIRNMKLIELTIEITGKTADKPFKPLTLPKLLSKRPQFAF